MANIVLHIGPHKTATSYIQAAFFRNRRVLETHGLSYFSIGASQAAHGLAEQWLAIPELPDTYLAGRRPSQFWDELVANHAGGNGNLFLSSENFCRCYPRAVNFAELAARLSAFETVKIVYTMRRQTESVPSIWAEIAKTRFVPGVWNFMRETFENRHADGVPIDHNAFFDKLCMSFRPEQIHLLDHAGFARHPGGAMGVFLELLNVDIPSRYLVRPSRAEANISPDPMALFVASQITGQGAKPPSPGLVRRLTNVLDRICGPRRSLLARHEYSKFRVRFHHGNQALVDKVQPVQPGFYFEEGRPPKGLFFREDLDADAWKAIKKAVL